MVLTVLVRLGQAHRDAASPDTGVFVGVSQLEYAALSVAAGSGLNAYHATGAHLSATSGRVSFAFGLTGPAVTVGAEVCLFPNADRGAFHQERYGTATLRDEIRMPLAEHPKLSGSRNPIVLACSRLQCRPRRMWRVGNDRLRC